MPECIKYFYSPAPASATDPIFAPFLSQHILLTQFFHLFFFIYTIFSLFAPFVHPYCTILSKLAPFPEAQQDEVG